MARRGVTLVGTVKSGALVDVVARGSAAAEAAAAARAFVRRAIGEAIGGWSPRAAGVVTAIVIGDRAGLGVETQRRLQEAGTYHVIAISGGNIAILAGLALGVFRLAGVLGRSAMLTAIAGLLAYAYLVGGGASVDRATLMAVVYLAARAIDLRGPPFNALALVAAILVATRPLTIADPGFLLTFGATWAVLAAAPLAATAALPFPLREASALLVASIAAEAMLFPVAAALFSRVTVAGLVLNFAAIPLMAVSQVAGMAAVVTFLLSKTAAAALGWVAAMAAEGLVRSADFVRVVPAVTWRVAPPNRMAVVLYYSGLVVLWRLSRTRWPVRGRACRAGASIVAVCAGLWILLQPWTLWASRGDGRLHVTFLDVGQGDSAFVQFPRGATMLVDAGGSGGGSSFDVGDRVVAPVLRRAGVRRLSTLALSHGDADHIGGARSILEEFRPSTVWEGIPVPPFEPLRALHAEAWTRRSAWTNVQAGDTTLVDDVMVLVHHPGLPDWERQDVRNDDSIVLELRWREVSIVLTGDIGSEVEQQMAPRLAPSRLRVVKVPHHGSLTSSSADFVQALRPQAAVISVGRSNSFGHPAAAVLARYRDAGAEIFRTDRDGAVILDTEGGTLTFKTFNGRRLEIGPAAGVSRS